MEAIGLYLFKSAAWLTGFALVYLLVLRNEHFFRLNRIYLLAGIIASLLFPFYTFHYAVILPAITSSADMGELSAGTVVQEQASPLTIYFWIYLFGSMGFLFRLLFQTWKIIRKLQKAGYERTGAVKLVRTPEFVSSFSFFSFVFVNPSIATEEMEEIMNHEREHIQQRHWFDLLLVELICIVQWFNPFAWIYAHLIRQNHEFLADESALQCTAHPAVYQAALLNQLLGVPVFSLTNSFSYSLNKKRFKMMKKKIDSPFRKLKLLLVLPLAAMLFYAFAVPEYQYSSENSNIAPEGKTMDVKGQVLKSDGTTPLPGTSVILRGSTLGTITDKDGNFLLNGIPASGELVFSFVGFISQVQKVGDKPMNIVMESNKVRIDQVTVVGYGTPPPPPPPPPLDLTKELNGPNPPLVLVDGVQVTKEAMIQIKVDQIESVSILKDESGTKLYGEKGKNGVVLIKTKRKAWMEDVVAVGGGKTPPGTTTPHSKVAIRTIDDANPPLIFLDGVPITKAEMDKLNPETFESISVLKDKSATEKYGEKAKNGVILIKTKGNKEPLEFKAEKIVIQDGQVVFTVVEEMPEFPGGEAAMRKFIAGNIKYPAEAIKEGIRGKVYVSFVVKADGSVADAKIARGVHPLLDNEAIRVVNSLPAWKPGKQAGKEVNVAYTVPVQFALDGDRNETKTIPFVVADTHKGEKEVFVVVEEMPEFPGGSQALRGFVAKSIRYPVEAQKEKTQGKVLVSFVVSSTGKVENAKIVRSVSPALDAEAIRVVDLMPDWKPGMQRGQAVSVEYTIPIEFKLQ
jgi:TonB family protein